MGNLPEEVAVENTHLVGTKVMPQLRHLWREHEDRWTPAGIAAIAARRDGAANDGRLARAS
jgi:hypothetical protein